MYELKKVIRDGKEVLKLKCPDCKIWAELDDDQYNGKVSILCDCGFHKTINLKASNPVEPNPPTMTFQAHLEWLNKQEPKTDFPLWKAMEIARRSKSEVGELECPRVPSKDEVDNFFDEYRPITHLTKDEFNVWYCNLQKDFHNLITKRRGGE